VFKHRLWMLLQCCWGSTSPEMFNLHLLCIVKLAQILDLLLPELQEAGHELELLVF